MTFGRRSPRPATRYAFGPGFWGLVTAFLLLVLTTAGCGGGSSSSPNNGGNNNQQNATVSGRVVDRYSSNQPLAGAIVTVGSQQAVTDSTGSFSVSVPTGTSTILKIDGPTSNAIYDEGVIGGTRYAIRTLGYPVPALTSAQNLGLGDIGVYSQSGPPRPPVFP
jgi:hypothetical protein